MRLDFTILSKICLECKVHEKLDRNTEEFKLLWEGQRRLQQKFEGSLAAMEPERAQNNLHRPKKLKLCYTMVQCKRSNI